MARANVVSPIASKGHNSSRHDIPLSLSGIVSELLPFFVDNLDWPCQTRPSLAFGRGLFGLAFFPLLAE